MSDNHRYTVVPLVIVSLSLRSSPPLSTVRPTSLQSIQCLCHCGAFNNINGNQTINYNIHNDNRMNSENTSSYGATNAHNRTSQDNGMGPHVMNTSTNNNVGHPHHQYPCTHGSNIAIPPQAFPHNWRGMNVVNAQTLSPPHHSPHNMNPPPHSATGINPQFPSISIPRAEIPPIPQGMDPRRHLDNPKRPFFNPGHGNNYSFVKPVKPLAGAPNANGFGLRECDTRDGFHDQRQRVGQRGDTDRRHMSMAADHTRRGFEEYVHRLYHHQATDGRGADQDIPPISQRVHSQRYQYTPPPRNHTNPPQSNLPARTIQSPSPCVPEVSSSRRHGSGSHVGREGENYPGEHASQRIVSSQRGDLRWDQQAKSSPEWTQLGEDTWPGGIDDWRELQDTSSIPRAPTPQGRPNYSSSPQNNSRSGSFITANSSHWSNRSQRVREVSTEKGYDSEERVDQESADDQE